MADGVSPRGGFVGGDAGLDRGPEVRPIVVRAGAHPGLAAVVTDRRARVQRCPPVGAASPVAAAPVRVGAGAGRLAGVPGAGKLRGTVARDAAEAVRLAALVRSVGHGRAVAV